MKQTISFLALIVLLSDSAPAQDPASNGQTGSICVAPVKDNGDPRGHFSENFAVRIDGEKWTSVPSDVPKLITRLSVRDKHLVTIRDGKKTMESFWFRFGEFESRSLCLWYKPWYRTWSLWDASDAGRKCRCSAVEDESTDLALTSRTIDPNESHGLDS
jgi:hypothetical protein